MDNSKKSLIIDISDSAAQDFTLLDTSINNSSSDQAPPSKSQQDKPLLQSLCSICHVNTPKYQCPACGIKSCSLDCCVKHKVQKSCSGLVDPTKFQSRSDLVSNVHLMNRDYNFLQTIDRQFHVSLNIINDKMSNNHTNVIQNKRKRGMVMPRSNNQSEQLQNDNQNGKTKRPRFEPGTENGKFIKINNVKIYQLPPGLSRSLQNKTGYAGKKSKFWAWTIEFFYKKSTPEEKTNTSTILESISKITKENEKKEEKNPQEFQYKLCHIVPETDKLQDAVRKFLKLPTQSESIDNASTLNITSSVNPGIVEINEEDTIGNNAKSIDNSELKIEENGQKVEEKRGSKYNYYLKKIYTPANKPQLIKLDGELTIQENLDGKSVIEFPSIYVLAEDDELPKNFTIINDLNSDDSSSNSSTSSDDSSTDDSSTDDSSTDDSSSDDSSSDDDGNDEDDSNEISEGGENTESKELDGQDDSGDEPPEEFSSKSQKMEI